MYKNLNPELLGISGRQSEIIELALTYGFRGIDIDIDDIVKRCQRGSFESASRFLVSSKLEASCFDAPIDLDADEETFTARAALLNGVAEIAQRIHAKVAVVSLPAATDRLPYPEYFDVVRKRVDQIAELFGKENVRLALTFSPQSSATSDKQFKFVQDVEGFTALLRACTSSNVGIVFDSWVWHIGGGTDAHLETIGLDKVAAIRLSDCREGVEAAAATDDDCLIPSLEGVIDNVGYMRKFAEAGLQLPVAARGVLAESGGTRDSLISATQDALVQIFEAAGLAESVSVLP